MKAILEFNLPEDEDDFNLCVRGRDYCLVLFDLDQWLRGKIRYPANDSVDTAALEEVRETLHELLQSKHVSLDDIK